MRALLSSIFKRLCMSFLEWDAGFASVHNKLLLLLYLTATVGSFRNAREMGSRTCWLRLGQAGGLSYFEL